jgi:tRNA A-37 threonylcarbamoyl transferase component Bud32
MGGKLSKGVKKRRHSLWRKSFSHDTLGSPIAVMHKPQTTTNGISGDYKHEDESFLKLKTDGSLSGSDHSNTTSTPPTPQRSPRGPTKEATPSPAVSGETKISGDATVAQDGNGKASEDELSSEEEEQEQTKSETSLQASISPRIFKESDMVGYDDHIIRLQHRPRGRSISDSLFHVNPDGTKDYNLSDMQRCFENEKTKKKRFNELNKILAERNVIIAVTDLQFVRKVGEGAFSEVWEGWWNGVHVAIKKLKIMVDDSLFEERFLREVETLRKGNHQNVVMFFGVVLKPPCIVTEFMAGGNLYDLLHRLHVKLTFPIVLKMATDLAVGLLHLHSLSILHRDLTSLNILLDEMGNVKISDFGLSREKSQEGSMTMTLGGICNPRWRPPEITKNLGHYSEKVDVFCFALVVWEMLTGEIPFADLDGPQAAAQVAYAGLRPAIPSVCHPAFRDLIQQCWVDDPKTRPDFKYIVEKLREIAWNNPMGFVSEMPYTPPKGSPLHTSPSSGAIN